MKYFFLAGWLLVAVTHSYAQKTATFYDDFKTNKNNWLTCNNTDFAASVSAKGYSLHSKGKSNQNVYHQLPVNVSADFTIEATITREFKKENYGFGIMFGGSDPGNIFHFLIEVTGDYTFFKYDQYQFSQLIPWTHMNGVNPIGKPNVIKVESRKGTLHFFVNGAEINQYKNFRAKGNLLGFVVGMESKVTVNGFSMSYAPVQEKAVLLDTAALPGHLILNEEFNDNYMQWDLHAGHTDLRNGNYELSNSRDSYLFWEDYAMLKVRDFAVETEMLLAGGSHLSAYGILLGIKGGSGDYLEFSITANGFFRLNNHLAWEAKSIVPWTFCPAIRSNAPNVVTASRRNDSLYFYINKRLALKHPDVILPGNGVGWILTDGIRKVNVSYLRIRQPLQKVVLGSDIAPASRERLTDNINSPAEEFGPVISPDGSILYFTRDSNPDIHGLEKDDVWYSLLRDKQWDQAVKMPAPLNNAGDCGVISVSADNRTLLLRGDYDDDEDVKEELYISHFSRGAWEKPTKVVVDGYVNKDSEEDFFLAGDKKILLSSFEGESSLGERDLYVSFLQRDSSWSAPLNLGNVVNTTSNDFSPYLAADNKTLYYSSFGMPSYGKADIYVTRRLDDTWRNWSPPLNLGNVINTELNDQGFALAANGTEAYLSSEHNTAGKADIFRVTLPPPVQPQPVVLIHGKVFDASAGKTLGTEIIYEDLSAEKEMGKARSQTETGEYRIILPYGEHYGINAALDGYLPLSENIDIQEKKAYQEIELDLYLIPIKAGQNFVMQNLFFSPASPAIAMKSYPELRKIVAIVKQYPSMKITIEGHTDDGNGESARTLQKLSVRRAEAVKNYFVTHGIQSERIQTMGYGKDRPIVPNKTNEDRQKNRRVEFRIDSM